MEGLKERFLSFRFKGMLVVAFVFAVIALVLFVERSGISYNYGKSNLDFMPSECVVTKQKANESLKKDTLVLWDSTQWDRFGYFFC